jgi:hypothetical protein
MVPGFHQVRIDGRSLSGGTYFIRLTTDENRELKKFSITK